VGGRAGNKCPPALRRPIDLDDWHFIFPGYRVRQYGNIPAMKKIKNSIIDRAESGSQLVNAISQQIRLGPSQFMASFHQAANANHALGIRLRIPCPQVLQPLPNGSNAIGILKEKQPGLRHTITTSQSIANMR
jgi:hypothetical protein